MLLTVVICTHNPKPTLLARTLDALRAQTLSTDNWELIVIDNASDSPLGSSLSLNWHPHARMVQEPELGLTPSCVRGIKEAIGDLLVLVDDDNLLASDYLAQVIAVASQHPF